MSLEDVLRFDTGTSEWFCDLSLVPSGCVGLMKQLEMLWCAVIGVATGAALGAINENLVGLHVQGEPSLGKYLIQRFKAMV